MNDRARGNILDTGSRANDNTVGESDFSQRFDIIRDYIVASCHRSTCLRSTEKCERTTRAAAEVYVRVLACGIHEIDDVAFDLSGRKLLTIGPEVPNLLLDGME